MTGKEFFCDWQAVCELVLENFRNAAAGAVFRGYLKSMKKWWLFHAFIVCIFFLRCRGFV